MENTHVGPFLILRKLGTSTRHRVYHARQTEQNRDVALKFVSVPPSIEWNRALDKIDRECDALQQLQHPNLVQVFGAGLHDGKVFFASELIDGESMTSLLARRGRLTADLVIDYATQIADLLAYLHDKGLVHSKLTPDKILVTPDNQIKVVDLRLNRARRRRWDAVQRRELDIAAYMAPEQFAEGATPKSDVYSLGVILFEMLTGKLPYEPDTIARMTRKKFNGPVPSVKEQLLSCPVWLDKTISQMLTPNPRKRPHSARAVLMAFEEISKAEDGRRAAVEQVSSSFNPLNAGADKSEARKLLGRGKRKKSTPELPFYQRTPFLIAALVGIALVLGSLLIPENQQAIFNKAKTMIASNNANSWTSARDLLKPIMKSGGPLAAEAESLYYESRQKSLVRHAQLELDHGLQSKTSRRFIEADKLRKQGQLLAAMHAFANLMADVEPDGNERHVHFASKANVESLANEMELPSDPDRLLELIARFETAQSNGDLIVARHVLGEILIQFAEEEDYAKVQQATAAMLTVIDQKTNGSLDLRPLETEALK